MFPSGFHSFRRISACLPSPSHVTAQRDRRGGEIFDVLGLLVEPRHHAQHGFLPVHGIVFPQRKRDCRPGSGRFVDPQDQFEGRTPLLPVDEKRSPPFDRLQDIVDLSRMPLVADLGKAIVDPLQFAFGIRIIFGKPVFQREAGADPPGDRDPRAFRLEYEFLLLPVVHKGRGDLSQRPFG